MSLYQVLVNFEKHALEARKYYDVGNHEAVRDELADAAGLIQREIGDDDEVDEKSVVKEEQPTQPGHCQPDAVREETPAGETKAAVPKAMALEQLLDQCHFLLSAACAARLAGKPGESLDRLIDLEQLLVPELGEYTNESTDEVLQEKRTEGTVEEPSPDSK